MEQRTQMFSGSGEEKEDWEDRFHQKYENYKGMLFKIAFSYTGNPADCEDIMQECFLKLLQYEGEFSEEEGEKRWLIRVAINLCKNHLKSSWKKRVEVRNWLEQSQTSMDEREKDLLAEVMQLPAKYRAVIYLHYYEGYRVEEMAGLLGIGRSAVKMRLLRARKLLRLELEGGAYETGRI